MANALNTMARHGGFKLTFARGDLRPSIAINFFSQEVVMVKSHKDAAVEFLGLVASRHVRDAYEKYVGAGFRHRCFAAMLLL